MIGHHRKSTPGPRGILLPIKKASKTPTRMSSSISFGVRARVCKRMRPSVLASLFVKTLASQSQTSNGLASGQQIFWISNASWRHPFRRSREVGSRRDTGVCPRSCKKRMQIVHLLSLPSSAIAGRKFSLQVSSDSNAGAVGTAAIHPSTHDLSC